MLREFRGRVEEEVRRDGQATGTAAGMRPGTNPLTPPNTLNQPTNNPHTHPLEPSNPPDVLGLSPRSQPRSGGSGVPSSESCNKAKAKKHTDNGPFCSIVRADALTLRNAAASLAFALTHALP